MTQFSTPDDPFDAASSGPFGQPAEGAADWLRSALPPGAIRLVPDDVEINGRLGEWLVFDKLQGSRRGGWGEIYLCVPADGSRLAMALKTYAPALLFNARGRRAFERECVTALLASYAFGVLPYSIDVIDGHPFLVMPAVLPGPRGEVNLRDLLADGPLPLGEAIYIARVIASALDEAGHYVPGLVHGDLKPENVLMLYGVPHVADFGLARFDARQVGADALKGTERYRSPEADDPGTALSVAADVYSYGVLLAEMLTGDAPGRGEHVLTDASESANPVVAALLGLADECRHSSPAARPASFAQVRAALGQIAPEGDWPLPREAVVFQSIVPMQIALGRTMVARGLLRLGQYDMVLDFIARTDPASREWDLWTCQGEALSLTGRDEEALASYEAAYQALEAGDGKDAWLIASEEVISLKRLERYDEAEELYQRLIIDAPDDTLAAGAVCNLAILWVDTERYVEAENLLASVLAQSPDMVVAWVNRAIAHERAGDPAAAAAMLRRAIALEPAKAEWHDRLGRLLMDELGWLDDAGVAFRNAMGCGSTDQEVFLRALACAVAIGDESSRDALLERIEEYGQSDPDGALAIAELWAFWYVRKFGGPDGPAGGDLDDVMLEALAAIGLPDPLGSDGEQPAEAEAGQPPGAPTGTASEPGAALPQPLEREAVAEPRDAPGTDEAWFNVGDQSSTIVVGTQVAARDPGQPFRHLQLRRAVTGVVYMDAYEPFDTPDYIDSILKNRRLAWIEAARMGGALAKAPFCLFRCPECAVEVATNRLAGSSLRCQRCMTANAVTPLNEPEYADLTSGLQNALGNASQPMDGWETLVVLQLLPTPPFPPPTEDTERELAVLLEQRGIELLPPMHPGVLIAMAGGVAAGNLRVNEPWIGGKWRYPPGSFGSSSSPPEQVLTIIDQACRLLIPARLMSATVTYDANSRDRHVLQLLGRTGDLEDLLRAKQQDKTDAAFWLALAGTAQINGDVERALGYAHTATSADPEHAPSWARIGSLRLASDDVNGAVAAAEHALRLNPAEREAYPVLAAAYQLQGRDSEAREMAARANAAGVTGASS